MSEFSTVVIRNATAPIRLCDGLLGGVISGAAAGDLMAELEQKNQRIEYLESAWHVDVIEGKDAAIAKQEAENDRLKTELEQYKRDAARMREALLAAKDWLHGWASADYEIGLIESALSAQPDHIGEANKMVKPEPKCSACGDSGILGHSALCECQQAEVKP